MNCQASGDRSWRCVGDVPVVQHRAKLFDLVVEEGLLLVAQPGLGQGQQLLPVRIAAEQLAFPTHRTGVQGFLFGLRDLRQYLAEDAENEAADEQAAQRGDAQYREENAEHDIHRLQGFAGDPADHRHEGHQHRNSDQPSPDGGAKKGQQQGYHQHHYYQYRHRCQLLILICG